MECPVRNILLDKLDRRILIQVRETMIRRSLKIPPKVREAPSQKYVYVPCHESGVKLLLGICTSQSSRVTVSFRVSGSRPL